MTLWIDKLMNNKAQHHKKILNKLRHKKNFLCFEALLLLIPVILMTLFSCIFQHKTMLLMTPIMHKVHWKWTIFSVFFKVASAFYSHNYFRNNTQPAAGTTNTIQTTTEMITCNDNMVNKSCAKIPQKQIFFNVVLKLINMYLYIWRCIRYAINIINELHPFTLKNKKHTAVKTHKRRYIIHT